MQLTDLAPRLPSCWVWSWGAADGQPHVGLLED
jgi:hypothetical protein